MANDVTIIFPHQLFQNHPALEKGRMVYLIEEWLFFRQYKFHRQKLILHRASMKFYENWLQQNGFTVHYIDTGTKENDARVLVAALAKQHITEIHMASVADRWADIRMKESCVNNGIKLHIYDNPNFTISKQDGDGYFQKSKGYFQTDFYIWHRKHRNMLLEKDGKPTGGKWTYDADNRRRLPKNEKLPVLELPKSNEYIEEAIGYVAHHFSGNYGSLHGPYLFGVTFSDAQQWLEGFLENRFEKFGIYEDAIIDREKVLYHSVLSPMLNIGLLSPQQIMDEAFAAERKYSIPLNSMEGFLRQIMGWREFIHLVYEREGGKQRTANFWKFSRKIPPSFWTGHTGIPPVDITIKKILQTGYCHHIERLMVLGNFMLLCEFDPDEVYRWFMEMFIDAYDWVMVPNIYGMSQFSDGGLMTTKPYISGSNYLMKMSNYEKGDWQQVWDGLFWRFMHTHRDFFVKNPRLAMLVNTMDKMPAEKLLAHLNHAEQFLNGMDKYSGR